MIDLANKRIRVYSPKNKTYYDKTSKIESIEDKGDSYDIKYFSQGKIYNRKKEHVEITESALKSEESKNIFNYFSRLADLIKIDNINHLAQQYQRLSYIDDDSILSFYINGYEHYSYDDYKDVIFPFGLNLSQKKAVENAFRSNISIIKGPPGTGKTQTILNILANIVLRGKSVAVVSNNNSATDNVRNKLKDAGFGFLAAQLGSKNLKEDFFEKEQNTYPDFDKWKMNSSYSKFNISSYNKLIEELYKKESELATLNNTLLEYKLEYKYFKEAFDKASEKISDKSYANLLKNNQLVPFRVEFDFFVNNDIKITNLSMLKWWWRYKLRKVKQIKNNPEAFSIELENLHYLKKIKELEDKVDKVNQFLDNKKFDEHVEKFKELSLNRFKYYLKYEFFDADKFRDYEASKIVSQIDEFVKQYPIVLSSIYSLRRNAHKNFMFDYLIVDEASQASLVSSALAMSCARNIVVVGDDKQLPDIKEKEIDKVLNDRLIKKFKIDDEYNYLNHSLLSSFIKGYKNAPSILLREHYRCHPKIINYCNKKFYNNELIVMTNEKDSDDPLHLIKTVEGKHMKRVYRGKDRGVYNQREIDETLEQLSKSEYEEIGVIAPYRLHVDKLNEEINEKCNNLNVEVNTIHKFQGREKESIYFSTVSNEVNKFIEQEEIINVAVSRAKRNLTVITSDKIYKRIGTNLGDLVKYIAYNSPEKNIVISNITSVFDLLYKDDKYVKQLELFRKSIKNKKMKSKYDSENLIQQVIEDVLSMPKYNSLTFLNEQRLYGLKDNMTGFSAEEEKYVKNKLTKVDFIIYSKMDKQPVLVIEVDGFSFHENRPEQLIKDRIKDKVLKHNGIEILRLKTNGSKEKEKIIKVLNKIMSSSEKKKMTV